MFTEIVHLSIYQQCNKIFTREIVYIYLLKWTNWLDLCLRNNNTHKHSVYIAYIYIKWRNVEILQRNSVIFYRDRCEFGCELYVNLYVNLGELYMSTKYTIGTYVKYVYMYWTYRAYNLKVFWLFHCGNYIPYMTGMSVTDCDCDESINDVL